MFFLKHIGKAVNILAFILAYNFYLRNMFQLGKTIISEQILDADFACNLSACKGACCVDGDAGAPLEPNETEKLKAIYPKIKPYLRPEGIQAIERQGTFCYQRRREFETPLVDGADCAYVIFDEKANGFVWH